MTISLTDVGKRYNREWILRHLNYRFASPRAYAITGPNGSGKSTLLQIIAGAVAHSEGIISFSAEDLPTKPGEFPGAGQAPGGRLIPPEAVYRGIAIAAPYLELVEEMTLREFLSFHAQFKPFQQGLALKDIMGLVGLGHAADKQIRYFSSGMKQRVKLAQAILSNAPVLLLDEPCTNLDEQGVALYRELMRDFRHRRLVIVSSNDRQEYEFCEEILSIPNYKEQ